MLGDWRTKRDHGGDHSSRKQYLTQGWEVELRAGRAKPLPQPVWGPQAPGQGTSRPGRVTADAVPTLGCWDRNKGPEVNFSTTASNSLLQARAPRLEIKQGQILSPPGSPVALEPLPSRVGAGDMAV